MKLMKKAMSSELRIALALIALMMVVLIFVSWQIGLSEFIRNKGIQAVVLPGFGGPQ